MKKIVFCLVLVLLAFCLVSCDYEKATYTVTFDANGADSGTAPSSIQVKKGSSFTVPSQGSLLKKDCVFAGWNILPDGGGYSFFQGEQDSRSRDVILYAIWRDDLLEFTYLSDSDSYSMTSRISSSHGRLPFLTVPSEYKDKPVTSIGESAFQDCRSLKEITIPSSVTSIGDYAFRGCSGLTSVAIPKSVTSIGDSAFSGCSSLTSITIPDSVTSIGDYAFYECSGLTSITIPDGVTSIEACTFDGCSGLTSITIPDSVTSIGDYAFYECSGLTSITIPDSVTSIGDYAFSYCFGLTNITIPSSVTSIAFDSFRGCNKIRSVVLNDYVCKNYTMKELFPNSYYTIKSVVIPEGVTCIERSAFYNCSGLTSITIPSSVTTIYPSAFIYCFGLTSITIPEGVNRIGNNAFESCSKLESICYLGTMAQWRSIQKSTDWNISTGNYTIHCIDGDIAKN